ncbi:amino acid adenylation domain-containing protein [Streptomyces avermitilis]|uniref:amino acid adenylation domain-containing protein n=1 Tax=Streptomyces avermitilis TaxID=33903 RepID=UPI0038130A00
MTQTQRPGTPVTLTAAAAYRVPCGIPNAVISERLRGTRIAGVWGERLPAPADGAAAARRRRLELRRPLSDAARGRAVLLHFADGSGELILVVRAAAGAVRDELDALARQALHGEPADAQAGPAVPPAKRAGEPAADHGVTGADPDPLTEVRQRSPEAGAGSSAADPATLAWSSSVWEGDAADALAALAVLVRRFTGTTSALYGLGGDRSAAVEIPDDITVGAFRAMVAAAAATMAAAPSDVTPGIGIVVDDGVPQVVPTAFLPAQQQPYPVTWYVHPGAGQVFCGYRPAEFPAWTAGDWAGQLSAIHRGLTGPDQERPLSEIALSEIEQLTAPLPTDADAPPAARTLHEVFAARADADPDAVAVVCGADQFTYGECDRISTTVARALRARGVVPGDRVGVLLGRGAELPVVLLGIVRSGAAYVPIDPGYPADRIAYQCEDAGLALLITEEGAEAPVGTRTVTRAELFAAANEAAFAPVAEDFATVGAADPAYVIYTSGSTGRPKGVVVPHGNVLALLEATASPFGLGPDDVWTWFHSVAFDFSVWEIWGCLLTGGRLVVVPDEVRTSPEDFHDLLADEAVTVLNQTPSAFGHLQEAACRRPASLSLRLVVFGGEPLDARTLLPWFDRYPPSRCRLVNMFGITETTVHVTALTVTRAAALEGTRSVGRPLPGWTARVVDEQQRPLPVGAIGEIEVGGVGLALHYLNRPELTAERFVTDPVTGWRWYRSGDRGRMTPDGCLEHLGRVDNQVKIRGHRIEPDEVRSVLLDLPDVAAAAVVSGYAVPGDRATARLEAYVVLASGPESATGLERVRRRTAELLPGYMVPSSFTALPRLPLTANGKLDVRRLAALPKEPAPSTPTPVAPSPEAARPGSAPAPDPDDTGETPLERAVLEVWRSVLGTSCGPDDHFFDVGGNSLLTVRITTALRDRGVAQVRVRDIYQHPTARRLAAVIAGSGVGVTTPTGPVKSMESSH